MLGNGAHGIVGDAGGSSATQPGGIREKRIQATVATLMLLLASSRIPSRTTIKHTSSRSM